MTPDQLVKIDKFNIPHLNLPAAEDVNSPARIQILHEETKCLIQIDLGI